MLPQTKMLCLPHFILYSQAAWEAAFGPVNLSLSQLRPHHLPYATVKVHLRTLIQSCSQGNIPAGRHSCWETFLPGYVPTSLNGFYSKQHLRGEQHVPLLFWHISQQTVKLKAKSLKGIMEKTKFLLITIFKTSEVTYSGKVDIKSNNAFSVDSLPWFVKARTSEEEWELPHIAHEGQPLCRAVTQHRQGLFPPQ